jgi:hypothetical protein
MLRATRKGRLSSLHSGRLQKLGWTEGRNIRIDTRWAAEVELMQGFAKELIALQPDLILANNTPTTAAVLQQTSTIPIIFAVVADPVGSGFVASFPRPGGNVTGFNVSEPTLAGKFVDRCRTESFSVVLAPWSLLRLWLHRRFCRRLVQSLEPHELFPRDPTTTGHPRLANGTARRKAKLISRTWLLQRQIPKDDARADQVHLGSLLEFRLSVGFFRP